MIMFCTPEWIASSTPYWINGLSTSGSISLGWALVAGRNRVPKPAAGNTALRTFGIIRTIVSSAPVNHAVRYNENLLMAYVIAEPCIGTKDTACIDACPVDCIHPKKDAP